MRVKVTQVRSSIGRTLRQRETLRSLGLGKINRSREHEAKPEILGMIEKVRHLVKVEEIN